MVNIKDHKFRSSRGTTLVEYVILCSMVSLVVVSALTTFGKSVAKSYEDTGGSITSMGGDDNTRNGGGANTGPGNQPDPNEPPKTGNATTNFF